MKTRLALLLAAALGTAAAPAAAQTTLVFSNWLPATVPFSQHVLMVWMKNVEQATGGRVRFNVLPKAVAAPAGHYDAVKDGTADVAFTVHGYTPGRFTLTKVVELPLMGDSAESISVAYQRLHERVLAKANEHRDVRALAVFAHGPGQIYTTKRAIARLEDLAGLKMRTGGGIVNDVALALGSSSLMKPATEAYELLSAGVADGTFFARESIMTFKLVNVVRHATFVPGGLFNTSFVLLMNEGKLAALPAADRDALLKASGEAFSRLAGKSFDDSDRKAVDAMREAKVEIRTADAAFVEQIRKATVPVIDNWVKEAAAKGVDGRAAVEALRAEARRNP
jgi:TRAP-type C4-dicarboxylate transport system substrate-binding protein